MNTPKSFLSFTVPVTIEPFLCVSAYAFTGEASSAFLLNEILPASLSILMILPIVLTALDGGFIESIGAIVGALGNMGPALGEAGPTANFTEAFSEPARLVLSLYMLMSSVEEAQDLPVGHGEVVSLKPMRPEGGDRSHIKLVPNN